MSFIFQFIVVCNAFHQCNDELNRIDVIKNLVVVVEIFLKNDDVFLKNDDVLWSFYTKYCFPKGRSNESEKLLVCACVS